LTFTFTAFELVIKISKFSGTPFRFSFPPRFRLPVTHICTGPAGEIAIAAGAPTVRLAAT
jgi:hypothetical protein